MAECTREQVIARIEQYLADADACQLNDSHEVAILRDCLILLRQPQEQERVEKRPVCPSCHKATTISQLLQYGACCDCSEDAPYDDPLPSPPSGAEEK
jgi:hypothetical protein